VDVRSASPCPSDAVTHKLHRRPQMQRNRGIRFLRFAPTPDVAEPTQVNRFGRPTAAEIQSSIDLFFPLLALPGAQARRAKIGNLGYGVPSDFELKLGRYLPGFGQADGDDKDTNQ
jgi:hypothetical protein